MSVSRDLRLALRLLARRPVFALLAVAPLVIAIGAGATISSLANALLLRPLPAADPASLVRLYPVDGDGRHARRMPYPDFEHYAARREVFAAATAIAMVPLAVETGDDVDQVLAEAVSGGYFVDLGVDLAAGRVFGPDDAGAGDAPVAVIGHRYWQRRFGGDPRAVGTVLRVSGQPLTVIGVAGERWNGTFAGAGIDLFLPLEQATPFLGPGWRTRRDAPLVHALARLAPGVTPEAAERVVELAAAQLASSFPETHAGESAALGPAHLLHGGMRRAATAFLGVVFAVAILLLLLACANVSGLLLARAIDRRREIALRLSLGASRARLARQLITESVVLALLGGLGGLVLARWALAALGAFDPLPSLPLHLDLALDARVLAFALGLTLATGLLLALAPLYQARRQSLAAAAREEGTATAGRAGTRLRGVLVVAQIALSLVLLVAAGLFARSLEAAREHDPGFELAHGLATDVDLAGGGRDPAAVLRFYRELTTRLEALPGVASAGLADLAPLDLATDRVAVEISGHEPPAGERHLRLSKNRVAPGYFETLGIPLLAGRVFTERDDGDAPAVAIVNHIAARRFWDGDPLGRRLRLVEAGREVEIVGVARDVVYRHLGEEPTAHVYLPLEQDFSESMTVLVRAEGEPAALLPAVQRTLRELDPAVQGFFSRTLEQHARFALLPARLASTLFTIFGAVALVLTIAGVFGAVAMAVARRRRELGIRQALGADRGAILRLVLGASLRQAALGVVLGLLAALALARLAAGQLFGVGAADPPTYLAVAALVVLVTLAASYLPARHATRVDPAATLRAE